jgi:hypothetical protein
MDGMTTSSDRAMARRPQPRRRPPGSRRRPRAAAERALSGNVVTFDLLGQRIVLLPADQLAFFAGLGLLAALEVIEWPVALAVAVGHQLAHSRHGRVLREFGDALEEA